MRENICEATLSVLRILWSHRVNSINLGLKIGDVWIFFVTIL
ncbi:rCG49847, isoform CRA_b [Rattus norvegicus]|uniref:RCG49847, isoform CRA_b n=1 Tax=Rattus norvegicus TaxID=10116 RepID=A6K4L2_RAT|nr:rCG49847, isoform CRA_b [Rattus norvegicus]